MVLQPGESTMLSMSFMMHGDMGGPHDFRVHLPTNDPAQPDRTVVVLPLENSGSYGRSKEEFDGLRRALAASSASTFGGFSTASPR